MALVCKTNPRLEASTSWGVIVSMCFKKVYLLGFVFIAREALYLYFLGLVFNFRQI